MFDHYLGVQQPDPALVRRRAASAMGAALFFSASMTFWWTLQAMSIAKVTAPQTEALIVALSAAVVPPPPPPPPPPAGNAGAETQAEHDDAIPDEVVPLEKLSPPQTQGDATPKGPSKPGWSGGVPGGPGVAPCPGCVGTTPTSIARPPTPTGPRRTLEDIDVVRARARYSPDPSGKEVARRLGTATRRSGTNKTAFCVEPSGRVSEVKTASSFHPAVDALCRDTVRKWRFDPLTVAGKARKTCSVVTFEFRAAP